MRSKASRSPRPPRSPIFPNFFSSRVKWWSGLITHVWRRGGGARNCKTTATLCWSSPVTAPGQYSLGCQVTRGKEGAKTSTGTRGKGGKEDIFMCGGNRKEIDLYIYMHACMYVCMYSVCMHVLCAHIIWVLPCAPVPEPISRATPSNSPRRACSYINSTKKLDGKRERGLSPSPPCLYSLSPFFQRHTHPPIKKPFRRLDLYFAMH
jgi:hypothetical protein